MTPERRDKMLSVLSKRQNNLTVVLENVFDPHNVSAIMRTCDAVGVQEIYVLNTRIPLHKKWGFKSSRSAKKWITVHQFADADECLAVVRKNYVRVLASYLGEGSINLYDVSFVDSMALIFGNEVDGVSDEIRKLSDGNFVIPQVGMIKSLNISVACAVTLYEAYRQKDLLGHYNTPSLPDDKIASLYNEWSEKNNRAG